MIAPLENNASYVAASEAIRDKRHRLRRTSGYLLLVEKPIRALKRAAARPYANTANALCI
ncbi:hypothetical protein [Kordiimonas sp.]|uniref:hypothetical protein n=1 Tax=Kordiimonas sp. TaxID=1970157 RepID=UPI003A8EE5F7